MAYKLHPGITVLNICGTSMLVSTRAYWEQFPRIRLVPPFWAGCLALMEKGKTDQNVVSSFVRLFHMPEEKVRQRVEKMTVALAEEGYLLPAEEKQ